MLHVAIAITNTRPKKRRLVHQRSTPVRYYLTPLLIVPGALPRAIRELTQSVNRTMADRRAVRSSSRRISPTPQPSSRHILPTTTRPTQRNAKRAAGSRGHETESSADRASLGLAPRGTPRGQKASTGSGQRSERKRSRPGFDPKKSWVLELLSNFLAKLINNYSGYTQRQSAS
jgi:hypothetical protein